MFQNPIFTLILMKTLSIWIGTRQTAAEYAASLKAGPEEYGHIIEIANFNQSGALLLTNCYVLHHEWVALLRLYGYNIFAFMETLETIVETHVQAGLKIAYVWFGSQPRKPPDKNNSKVSHLGSTMTKLIWFIEDAIYLIFKIDIDINYWIYILYFILQDIFSRMNRGSTQSTSPRGDDWYEQHSKSVTVVEMNKKDRIRFKFGKTITSNILVSLTARSKKNRMDDVIKADSDSYSFAIDTCTSEGICKHKELFVGAIKKCHNIFVQGVGGKISVEGYGTIKIRIVDDDNAKHDLLIHNVLYVPDSPANLLSPQRWSQGSNSGTGEITVEGSTLLFWNDRKSTKLIPHHPELGIPIMSVNDGYTKCQAFLNSTFCQPCMPAYLQTSQTAEVNNTTHVIPLDDDEESYHNIEQSRAPLLVDELEQSRTNIIENLDSLDAILPNDDDTVFDLNTDDYSIGDDKTVDDDDNSINLEEPFDEINKENEVIEVPQNEIDEIRKAMKDSVTPEQKELMAIHWKMKHLPFGDIKKLAEKGVLPKRLAKVDPPLCPSCIMGKQHRKPWRGRGKRAKKSIRKPEDNFPGANTSTDQMISPFGGFVPQMKGKLTKAKFYAANIFVDHFTDYTYVHLMKDTTADSTLEAKNAYERLMNKYRHKVKKYHADNGRFAENAFVNDVHEKGQSITYCGVGSHHQNGIAERRIKTLGEDARTILAHGQHLWPEVVTKAFWPFAYKAACRARNKFKLDEKLLSPEEKMSGTRVKQTIKHEHPLFCPVYALHSKLQSGIGGIPKWEPRSNAGVYLGHSPEHASDVALVLNLGTGLVSPQFHVIFDDTFSTVEHIRSAKEPTNWENLCKYHAENYTMDPVELEDIRKDSTEFQRETMDWFTHSELDNEDSAIETPNNYNGSSIPAELNDESDLVLASEGAETEDATDNEVSEGATERQHESIGQRRSQRVRKAPDRFDPSSGSSTLTKALSFIVRHFTKAPSLEHSYVTLKQQLNEKIQSYEERMHNYDRMVELNVDGSINYEHPLSYVAKTGQNDVFHFHQAMREPDRDDFIQAMVKEIKDHEDNGHWMYVKRETIGKAPTVKAIWSFKRKRRPDGSLLKHKARLCAHGGMQIHGVNFWDTYAPVVNWITIRMMLTLSVIHDLYTTSIDFTLAFPQADIETTIYMEIPLGCEVPEGDYVCKLIKNVYGIRQASKTWFEYLRDTLIKDTNEGGFGFRQSKVDPCIFYRNGVTVITWVDDCMIFAKSKKLADELIEQLRTMFTLTEEEEVSAYLGVQMKFDEKTETVSLSQPYLITRIIELLGDSVKDANIKDTPAVYKEILHKDEHGPERKQSWNYRSAIGMLNYLAATTRPDCLFAVHQCARFSADPKLSHERALKRILRYLKGTNDKGIILKPNREAGIQCYVDADFAGGYMSETSDEPVSVFSRTGYAIFYLGCPIVWVSKLQSEISLSTVEAEYIALSTAMRDIIPLMDQVKEMDLIYGNASPQPKVHCTVFEDNNGTLELANKPRYRPRTKHIAVKYHHFREHVRNKLVSIEPIDTKEQIADQFTKGLQVGMFEYLRYKLLHW
jgi:hypothetical protein